MSRWWFAPHPLARVAVLRTVLYLFVPLDVLVVTPWVGSHGAVPVALYSPVLLPRLLHLPTPTMSLVVLEVVLLTASLVAAAGRLPRLAGAVVAVGYTEWMFVAMSYSKIDHDRFALLVALWVLPTVGRAHRRDLSTSEAAGWALRAVTVAVVATYFLSAWAKMRWGGWGWANGETFYWAMSRRGTWLGHRLLDVPWALHVFQWVVLAAEASSPLLLLLRPRWQRWGVAFFVGFHAMTYATISIHFLPHVVCLLAFLPLEQLPVRIRAFAVRAGSVGGSGGKARTSPRAVRAPAGST